MKKKKTKAKSTLPDINKIPILKPITIDMLGTSSDPCFGEAYDLSTNDCRSCGDSELCAIKFAKGLGKTRKELEKDTQFKDLDVRIDQAAAKKYYRKLKREGKEKVEILDSLQKKFELSRKEARELYRKFIKTN